MLQYSKGICVECGEDRFIVKPSKKLCQKCNESRLELVRGKKKPKPLRVKIKPSGERLLFSTIWESRNKRSFVSGRDLTKIPPHLQLNIYAHVIPKGLYPKFRLYDKNIVLLHPDEHHLYDFGTEEQREDYAKEYNCSWDELYKLRDELKKEYLG